VARARLDEARSALLTNVIETYLPLKATDQDEFQRLVAFPDGKEIREMISVYEQRGIERGIERGKREALLRLMRPQVRRRACRSHRKY